MSLLHFIRVEIHLQGVVVEAVRHRPPHRQALLRTRSDQSITVESYSSFEQHGGKKIQTNDLPTCGQEGWCQKPHLDKIKFYFVVCRFVDRGELNNNTIVRKRFKQTSVISQNQHNT